MGRPGVAVRLLVVWLLCASVLVMPSGASAQTECPEATYNNGHLRNSPSQSHTMCSPDASDLASLSGLTMNASGVPTGVTRRAYQIHADRNEPVWKSYSGSILYQPGKNPTDSIHAQISLTTDQRYQIAYLLDNYGLSAADPSSSYIGVPLTGEHGSISVQLAIWYLTGEDVYNSHLADFAGDAGAIALAEEAAYRAGPYKVLMGWPHSGGLSNTVANQWLAVRSEKTHAPVDNHTVSWTNSANLTWTTNSGTTNSWGGVLGVLDFPDTGTTGAWFKEETTFNGMPSISLDFWAWTDSKYSSLVSSRRLVSSLPNQKVWKYVSGLPNHALAVPGFVSRTTSQFQSGVKYKWGWWTTTDHADDLYMVIMNQWPNATQLTNTTNNINNHGATQAATWLMPWAPAPLNGYNSTQWINHMYQKLFGRNANSSEMTTWTNSWNNNGGAHVLASITSSNAAKQRGARYSKYHGESPLYTTNVNNAPVKPVWLGTPLSVKEIDLPNNRTLAQTAVLGGNALAMYGQAVRLDTSSRNEPSTIRIEPVDTVTVRLTSASTGDNLPSCKLNFSATDLDVGAVLSYSQSTASNEFLTRTGSLGSTTYTIPSVTDCSDHSFPQARRRPDYNHKWGTSQDAFFLTTNVLGMNSSAAPGVLMPDASGTIDPVTAEIEVLGAGHGESFDIDWTVRGPATSPAGVVSAPVAGSFTETGVSLAESSAAPLYSSTSDGSPSTETTFESPEFFPSAPGYYGWEVLVTKDDLIEGDAYWRTVSHDAGGGAVTFGWNRSVALTGSSRASHTKAAAGAADTTFRAVPHTAVTSEALAPTVDGAGRRFARPDVTVTNIQAGSAVTVTSELFGPFLSTETLTDDPDRKFGEKSTTFTAPSDADITVDPGSLEVNSYGTFVWKSSVETVVDGVALTSAEQPFSPDADFDNFFDVDLHGMVTLLTDGSPIAGANFDVKRVEGTNLVTVATATSAADGTVSLSVDGGSRYCLVNTSNPDPNYGLSDQRCTTGLLVEANVNSPIEVFLYPSDATLPATGSEESPLSGLLMVLGLLMMAVYVLDGVRLRVESQ